MEAKNRFSTQSLFITLFFNLALTAGIVFVTPGAATALVFGLAAAVTLALWLTLRAVAGKLIDVAAGAAPEAIDAAPAPTPIEAPKPIEPPKPVAKPEPRETAAVQMLAIFQRKGRLIDFLQEDIRAFSDDQIGAAVRNIHEGCRAALDEHVTLEPVMTETEGTTVTVDVGFDAEAIRLTGPVTGAPPFTGALRHKGWQVARIELPERVQGGEAKIVAPAEVEVS